MGRGEEYANAPDQAHDVCESRHPVSALHAIAKAGQNIRWRILLVWLIFLIPSLGGATDFTTFPYEPFAQLYTNTAAAQAACDEAQAALPVTGFGNFINGQAIFKDPECLFRGSDLFIASNLTALCRKGTPRGHFVLTIAAKRAPAGASTLALRVNVLLFV